MAQGEARTRWLDRIRANIESAGYHVTAVQGSASPRFAYTIGMYDIVGHEVVLPGAQTLSLMEVKRALDEAVDALRGGAPGVGSTVVVEGVGSFRTGPVDDSWAADMLLGALDLYDLDRAPAVQLVPQGDLRTIDVPDLSKPWDPEREPVWRWLKEPWPFAVPSSSTAATDLHAMRGEPVSKAARWEEDYWEMFAREWPDGAPARKACFVPLATLVGFDASLAPVTRLDVGSAIRRTPPGPWESWEA